MRDITVMDNLTPSDLPPQSGWIAALILAVVGLLKGAWPWLKSRDAAHAKLTKEERDAQRAEERDLVITLKKRVEELVAEVKTLRDLLDASAKDRIELAKRDERIKSLQADLDRVREDRDRYRTIAEAGQRVAARAGQISAASELLDEISEADEATSIPGGKP